MNKQQWVLLEGKSVIFQNACVYGDTDYPSIARLLDHKLNDFQRMEIDVKQTECAPSFQTYVKQINEQDNVVVALSDMTPCGPDDKWTLKGLDQELRALKEKYAR
jgi:hypothetical protein